MDKKYLLILYNNLFKYLEYRKSPIPKKMSKNEFIETMGANHMVTIESGKIYIIMTLPGGKFAVLGAEGKKKLKDIAGTSKYEELLYICDVNYISLKTATSMNAIKKTIVDLKTSFKDVWFQIRPYKIFELVIPECSEVVPHRIMTEIEIEEYLREEYKNKSAMPCICEFESVAVWNGIRAGMFVEIDRGSVSVLMQKVIRHCVEGY